MMVKRRKHTTHIIKKQKHIPYNDDPNESNDEESVSTPDISSLFKSLEKNKVFRDNNHIYFRCDVTIDRVNKLCNLIDEYNREQDALNSSTTTISIAKPIYLHITSTGGDLLAGFMAYDYIKNSNIPIYTIAEGYCISSGANMFMAGAKRLMTEHSYLLIHQLSQSNFGHTTFHDMIDNASNILEFMTKLYGIYLNGIRYNRTNVSSEDILTKEKLENHMLHDIYWDYNICIKYGLCDELYYNYNKHDNDDINDLIKKPKKLNNKINKIYKPNDLLPSNKIVEKLKEIFGKKLINCTINTNTKQYEKKRKITKYD